MKGMIESSFVLENTKNKGYKQKGVLFLKKDLVYIKRYKL